MGLLRRYLSRLGPPPKHAYISIGAVLGHAAAGASSDPISDSAKDGPLVYKPNSYCFRLLFLALVCS